MDNIIWFLLGGVVVPVALIAAGVLMGWYYLKKSSVQLAKSKTAKAKVALVPARKEKTSEKGVMVLRFPKAEARDPFRAFASDVDETLKVLDTIDKVVVIVNSPGGAATSFGYAYAQMERLRATGLEVISVVDEVAASGGYLLILASTRIIGAEWAVFGSVGVVAFVPNVREAAAKLGIKTREYTPASAPRKRTVSLYDNATPEDEAAFLEKLSSLHEQFKGAVLKWRPQVSVDLLNGDTWTGEEAIKNGLIDEIGTSNEVLFRLNEAQDLYVVNDEVDPIERLFKRVGVAMADRFGERVIEAMQPGMNEPRL